MSLTSLITSIEPTASTNLEIAISKGLSREEVFNSEKPLTPLMNPLMLSITYKTNKVIDHILDNKMFTPEELRDMKNTMGYNLITLSKIFNNPEAEKKIRDYVLSYKQD